MRGALKSGYGHFPRGREGYRTIWRKKKFLENFPPPPKSPKPRMSPKGTTAAFGTSLWTAPRTIFFPKSFFYTLVMRGALKSGYGHLPSGREGYRTIWRKKTIFTFFFPFSLPRHPGTRFGPDNVGSL